MADDRESEEEEDDFSFPSILGNPPCSIDSPPWLYSPSNQTSLREGEREEPREKKEEGGVAVDTSIREGSREEKMDTLWEDFNEELWGSSTAAEKCFPPSPGDSREFGFGKTGCSKGNNKGGGVVSAPAKRPGTVAFVKALRKLFLLRGGAVAAARGPGPGTIKTKTQHRRGR